jgi:thymidine phosphorylase
LVSNGTHAGVRTEAFITPMETPLGRAVGNALEIRECIETLRGEGPPDLEAIVLRLAARMVQLGGRAETEVDARAKVEAAIASGAALDRFRRLIERQGGDAGIIDHPSRLPAARYRHTIAAARSGFVTMVDAFLVGRASVELGAGRDKKGDPVDFAAGLRVIRKPGERVSAGDPVLELHYNDPAKLPGAVALVADAIAIGNEAPAEAPLVIGWVYDAER